MASPRLTILLSISLALLAGLEMSWLLNGLSSHTFAILAAIVLASLVILLAVHTAAALRGLRWRSSERLVEAAMAEERFLLQALLDNVPDRIYFKDVQSRFQRINRALAERFGLADPGEILGKTDADFFAAEFARQTRADEEEVMRRSRSLVGKEEKETWPDGRETWAVTTTLPFHDRQGRVVGIIGLSRDITERKRAEEALHRAEEKYRGIFEHAVEGIYQTTVDARFLTANPMLAHIYGFASAQEFLACADVPANHFYVEPGRRAEFMRRMRTERSLTGFESQIRRRDGSLVWISENARSLYAGDGTLLGYEGTAVDITERKHAEETLRKANDALRAIIQASPLAIFSLDLAGTIQSWNAAAERIFGWTEAEVLHLPTPLVPPDRRAEFAELVERLKRGEAFAGVQVRRLHKDGRLIDVSVSAAPLYDADGQVSGITVLGADLTAIQRAEQALVQERALLRALVDSIPDLIFYKDRAGVYLGCNAAFARHVGRPQSDIVGKAVHEVLPQRDGDRYQQQDRAVLQSGQAQRYEEPIDTGDSRRTLYEVLKSPFFDANGRILGLIGISRDITERKILEEQLRQAQKMEAVGQLAGGIAHDFNNLLTAILGNVSLLLAALPEQDPNREVLRETERAATRAAELTRQLLGFSRQTMLQLEAAHLGRAVEEAVALLRRTIDPRITVQMQTPADLWSVQADANQISQVLMNLCLNARDAMPQGGQLVLETANVVLDGNHARQQLDARPGEFVRLRVADTGTGIPAEIQSRIFDPFFTTKEPGKGTGLGLAMVFGIVKQHQGWIECHSEVGTGTHFDIFLPGHRGSVVCPPAASAPETPVGGSETILLVDDEAVIRNLGRTILQRYGYRMLLAEDGQEAVEIYRRRQGAIDLVVLDLTMPRLSGRDTLRQLLQIDPQVRVLFSSGYSAEHFTESSKEGVLGFVNKPYRPQDLVNTVRQALDRAKREVG